MNELISRRLKVARDRAGLTQAQLSEKLGFKDRQTLAAIEAGRRKLSAEELVRAMQVFEVDLDYFTDGFRLVGEGTFSWRAKNAAPGLLDKFEARAGRWIATYRNLGEGKDKPASTLQGRLSLTERSTFEQARAVAEALGTEWALGEIPALILEKRRKAGVTTTSRTRPFMCSLGSKCRRSIPSQTFRGVEKASGSSNSPITSPPHS